MNKIIIVTLLICLTFATQVKKCPKNAKQNCTQEFKEVCGITGKHNEQKRESFANHCIACSQGKVKFTVEGNCEKFPENVEFCSPKEKKAEFCTEQSEPTCGWLDTNVRCHSSRCFINYANKCEACQNKRVIYTSKGDCRLPDSL